VDKNPAPFDLSLPTQRLYFRETLHFQDWNSKVRPVKCTWYPSKKQVDYSGNTTSLDG